MSPVPTDTQADLATPVTATGANGNDRAVTK